MTQFILLFLCLLLGLILKKFKRLPESAPQVLSGFIVHISLPALAIVNLHRLEFSRVLWFPIMMPWLLFAIAIGFFSIVGRSFHWDKKRIGCLILVGGLANTSFVGIPMLDALLGQEAIPIGMILDQMGTFLTLSIGGIFIASVYSSGKPSLSKIFLRIVTFPPFWAVVFGLSTRGIEFSDTFTDVLEKLALTLTPLALVSVGLQLELHPSKMKPMWQPLSVGLFFKLFLAPVIFCLLGFSSVSDPGDRLIFQVTVLESAMAPMIVAGIVAQEFGLEPPLASQMVGVGIALSLITVPLWNAFI